MEQNGPNPAVINGSFDVPGAQLRETELQFEQPPEPTLELPVEVSLTEYLQNTYLVDKSAASLQRHVGLTLMRAMVIDGVEKPYATNKNRFSEWDNAKCIKYGEFLIQLIDPDNLSHTHITHAARAGIGPGVSGIERRFGSIAAFYKELGVAKDNPRNHFDDWSIANYIEYIQGVARMNDGEVSESIIRRHYNEAKKAGTNLPSPSVIKKATGAKLGLLIEMAGFRVPTRPKSADACVLAAIDFYESNGRWPNSRDLQPKNGLPSWPTVRKYCGSIPEFITLAEQTLEQIAAEDQELLAA